jgi:hypothetical protein
MTPVFKNSHQQITTRTGRKMYSRNDLEGRKFGSYEVKVADHIINLKDGTKISTRFWFPGPQIPFEAENWKTYCGKTEESESTAEVQ